MKQLLIYAEAFGPGKLHIAAQQQVEAVKTLGDDRAQLGRHILEMPLEIYGIVVKHLLDVISLVGMAQQVVSGHTEIFGKKADRLKVRLFALRLVAGDGRTLL